MQLTRLSTNPLITPDSNSTIGSNINGPSLIKTPDWISDPLGKYYLYFAHHKGDYIRMAYSDDLRGPWTIYEPGTVQLEESELCDHISSPDVHVIHEEGEIRMYFHGVDDLSAYKTANSKPKPGQKTRVAVSRDGLSFDARDENLGNSYFRVFKWDGEYVALAMPGQFYKSKNGLSNFESGPEIFTDNMRHSALQVVDETLRVFFTKVSDRPERILFSTIDLSENWWEWEPSQPETILIPKKNYEGVDLPVEPSERGAINKRKHQLRDPAIFEEDNQSFLFYSIAGENGIAAAKLEE